MSKKLWTTLILILAILTVGFGTLAISRAIRTTNTDGHLASTNIGSGATLTGALEPGQVTRNPERDAYFGETHVHTSWSFDAYVFGNTVTGPTDAYKYAMGETIKHPWAMM